MATKETQAITEVKKVSLRQPMLMVRNIEIPYHEQ